MHMLQNLFYLMIALHVSGIIITHLQENKTTVTTASGNRYTVIDRVKFLLLKSTYRLD
jgi:cytochrome b